MILIISICKEPLHELEFVNPVRDIVVSLGLKYKIRHYNDLKNSDLDGAKKVIICGTSLKDNSFVEDLRKFSWILKFNKPVLGICGGMQILGRVFKDGRIVPNKQIGLLDVEFKQDFLGVKGNRQVYELHNFCVVPNIKDFKFVSFKSCSQAIKHRKKNLYGVMFHPEVRNKDLIEGFCKLGK